MTNGRKMTLNERIQAVSYCLEHNKNYRLAAENLKVSYQQVYQWVKKYEAGGEEVLKDKRGKNKTEQELTPEGKFKIRYYMVMNMKSFLPYSYLTLAEKKRKEKCFVSDLN